MKISPFYVGFHFLHLHYTIGGTEKSSRFFPIFILGEGAKSGSVSTLLALGRKGGHFFVDNYPLSIVNEKDHRSAVFFIAYRVLPGGSAI